MVIGGRQNVKGSSNYAHKTTAAVTVPFTHCCLPQCLEGRDAVIACSSVVQTKEKVRKNRGRNIVLQRRLCQTSSSLEAFAVDNTIFCLQT